MLGVSWFFGATAESQASPIKTFSSLLWLVTMTSALDLPPLPSSPASPWRGLALHSPANWWNWWPLCCLFSCKFVQIENIVHQRGSPILFRCFAPAFLLFPWERCSLSSATSQSHSRLPLAFWQTAWRNGQRGLTEQALQLSGIKRERDVLQAPPLDTPPCLFFFPPLRGWVII